MYIAYYYFHESISDEDLMEANLSDLTVIVMGLDNHPDLDSNHPAYIFGIGQNGTLAGFQSVVIWT